MKKRALLLSLFLLLFSGCAVDTGGPVYTPSEYAPSAVQEQTIQPQKVNVEVSNKKQENPQPATAPLSNNNYYTNVDGNEVHSPAYSSSVPMGATALCGDGTYSFSQHRSGTCSRHGGVAEWL